MLDLAALDPDNGGILTTLSSPHFNTVDLSASGVASSDVRIGHFGVCVGSSDFVCTNITTTFWSFPTGRKSNDLIISELGGGGDSGTEELVTLALALEKKIALFPLPAGALILAANVIFCCLWTSVGLLTISTLILYGTLASKSALNFVTGNIVGDKVKVTRIMDKPSKRYQMHREEFVKAPKGDRGMMAGPGYGGGGFGGGGFGGGGFGGGGFGGPGYGGGYGGGFGGYPGMGPVGGYPDLEMPQMAYGRGTRQIRALSQFKYTSRPTEIEPDSIIGFKFDSNPIVKFTFEILGFGASRI
ncbi:hypothetical protein B7494_g5 [Chlorociboria aeruginascens]|nr:hypothetical protein B7494_g5 [Chlorociboria aeruginascens]